MYFSPCCFAIGSLAMRRLEPKTRVRSSRVKLSCRRKHTLSGLGSQSRIQGKGGLGDAGRSLVARSRTTADSLFYDMSNNMIHETVCK